MNAPKTTSRSKVQLRDMTAGVVWQQLVLFAVPLILGDLLQQLYSTVDSIIIGQFMGKAALAAVTGTETAINILIGIYTGLSAGATIVLSHLFGAKEYDDLHDAVQTTMTLTLISGVFFSVLGVCIVPLLLKMLAVPDDVYRNAQIYLTIYFGGMMGLVMYNMCSSILRAVGNTKLPLLALTVTSVSNICLDLLFVVVFHWGIVGAAGATVLSQLAAGLFLLCRLCAAEGPVRVELLHLTMKKRWLLRILKIGIPFSIQRSLVAVSNTLVISRINYFGSGAMAAWGVYRKIDTLMMNVAQNLSVAVSTFVGQNYGAKKKERIRSGIKAGYVLVLCFSAVFITTVIFSRRGLVSLFNREEDVITFGCHIILFLMPFQFISSVNQIQAGTLRGYGDSQGPMLITLFSHIAVRQTFLFFAWRVSPKLETALMCYPIGWACCAFLTLLYSCFKTKKLLHAFDAPDSF